MALFCFVLAILCRSLIAGDLQLQRRTQQKHRKILYWIDIYIYIEKEYFLFIIYKISQFFFAIYFLIFFIFDNLINKYLYEFLLLKQN